VEVVVILLIVLINFVSAILLIVAPFAVPALIFYLMRRYGIGIRSAVFISVVPTLLLLAWVFDGLYGLSDRCRNTTIVRATPEKLGPIDALLIDGPGMWWLYGKIDIERPEYGRQGKTDQFGRREAKKENRKPGRQLLSEAELRSRYKVTVGLPTDGNFWQRYQTSASIVIEERSTGKLVASVEEPAWGGGVAGSFVAALSKLSPFYSSHRYLSCGYAGQEIGIFRGDSKDRRQLYEAADQKLIEQVFILAGNK
jgi:hypothetical protein